MRSPRLQAGAAMENDHHILAQSSGLLLLPFAQALTSRHHQHDRHNPPGNAKHGEECAEFVRPEGSHDVDNEVSQGHRASLTWTRPGREGKPTMPGSLLLVDTYPRMD